MFTLDFSKVCNSSSFCQMFSQQVMSAQQANERERLYSSVCVGVYIPFPMASRGREHSRGEG